VVRIAPVPGRPTAILGTLTAASGAAGTSGDDAADRVEAWLAGLAASARTATVVVDEADALDDAALTTLAQLTGRELAGRRPLQVVLAARPAFESRLGQPGLAELSRQVAARSALTPLSNKETRHYLHHRVAACGGDGAARFPRETCRAIRAASGGIPRGINVIAAEALRLVPDSGTVTAAHVKQALEALAGETGVPQAEHEASATPQTALVPPAPASPAPASVSAATPGGDAVANQDPQVRAWVERFTAGHGPIQIGSRSLADAAAIEGEQDWEPYDASPLDVGIRTDVRIRAPDGDASPSRHHAETPDRPQVARPAPMRRSPPRARAPRSTPGWTALLGTGLAGAVLATVVLIPLLRGTVHHLPATGRVAATQAGSTEPVGRSVEHRPVSATAGVASGAPGPQRSPAVAPTTVQPSRAQQPADRAREATPAAAAPDSAARVRRYSLAVGSYLDEGRALNERDRVQEDSGLDAWIVTVPEHGTDTYQVVVGIFRSEERAEQAATALLERGVVGEARVVPLPSRHLRR
jgi:cell division protein FtsN